MHLFPRLISTLFAAAVLLPIPTALAADEPSVLSVTAERLDPRWGGQTIQFIIENKKEKEKRKATLFLSSNFVGKTAENVRLGHFEAIDMKRMELDRQTLINWQLGLGAESSEFADINKIPKGAIYATIGGYRLDPHSPLRSDALTFLERVWDLATWKPMKAVRITKKAGSNFVTLRYKGDINYRERKTIEELGCIKLKKIALACQIPHYGIAYLLP